MLKRQTVIGSQNICLVDNSCWKFKKPSRKRNVRIESATVHLSRPSFKFIYWFDDEVGLRSTIDIGQLNTNWLTALMAPGVTVYRKKSDSPVVEIEFIFSKQQHKKISYIASSGKVVSEPINGFGHTVSLNLLDFEFVKIYLEYTNNQSNCTEEYTPRKSTLQQEDFQKRILEMENAGHNIFSSPQLKELVNEFSEFMRSMSVKQTVFLVNVTRVDDSFSITIDPEETPPIPSDAIFYVVVRNEFGELVPIDSFIFNFV